VGGWRGIEQESEKIAGENSKEWNGAVIVAA